MTWRPLSVRDSRSKKDEGPYEGVPPHLYEPLRDWVDRALGGNAGSFSDSDNGPPLAAALRYPVKARPAQRLTVREVTQYLSVRPVVMLDAVDAALHISKVGSDSRHRLDRVLELGGSVWQVGPNGDCLVRRVDPAATSAFAEVISTNDAASAELKAAWTAAYGRNPDASDAWDHSIKAVETVLIPVVTPAQDKATLSHVIGTLNNQGHLWRLAIPGHDRSESVAPLVSMLRLMWPNPDRHGGQDNRPPSQIEAQAVVHLAVTTVQWARSQVVQRRS